MSVDLYRFKLWEWIQNTANWTSYQWTWKDYAPYFNRGDLWKWKNLWDLDILNERSSYNLHWFQRWNEVSFWFMVIVNNWTVAESWEYWLKIYRKLSWESEQLQFDYTENYNLSPRNAQALWAWTWVDIDEEWNNIEYMKYVAYIDWNIVWTKTCTYTNIWDYQNIANHFTLDSAWYIWIYWDNIIYVDYWSEYNVSMPHLIRNDWNIYSTWKEPGYIRVDKTNHWKLWYIDQSWNERKTYTWRNYWKFDKLVTWKEPGYIWVSDWTDNTWAPYCYLNWIGYDWKHYCIINWPVSGYEWHLLP